MVTKYGILHQVLAAMVVWAEADPNQISLATTSAIQVQEVQEMAILDLDLEWKIEISNEQLTYSMAYKVHRLCEPSLDCASSYS